MNESTSEASSDFERVFTAEEKRIYLQLRLFLVNYQCKRLGNIYIIAQYCPKLIVLTIQLYGPFKLGNMIVIISRKQLSPLNGDARFILFRKFIFFTTDPFFSFSLVPTDYTVIWHVSEWLFKICLQITKLFWALPARKGLGRCEKHWMFHEDCFYSSNPLF